ncbi:hypothetical protein AAFF_G00158120 [Aldrovandia affinis]|uniref:Uncharacterized protein n=1 Tax=Aldrovandia affinis TaxID=143900 RepID=A0AAD7RN22_9TELE|nr:hypothetical protein AAFF_G00158120 [Aldrovandia affinis]
MELQRAAKRKKKRKKKKKRGYPDLSSVWEAGCPSFFHGGEDQFGIPERRLQRSAVADGSGRGCLAAPRGRSRRTGSADSLARIAALLERDSGCCGAGVS